MPTSLITLKNIRKVFPRESGRHRVEVLTDVDLTIHKGEFLVLLGPSGCGKSTLLRIIAGFDHKTGGDLQFDSSFKKENMNFVFQNFGLLPWLSIHDNVALGLVGRDVPLPERTECTHEILKKFGLFHFKDSMPHELSGGMKQRVGLARAFVTKPEIIFLDEPFSELDFFTAETLRNLLLDMWKELGTTVVMVSHYIDEAVELADRIAVFSPRPSKITHIVTNELARPRNHRSDPFFKKEDEILGFFKREELDTK